MSILPSLTISLAQFSAFELALIFVVFVWTGFIRTGLGFGGAAFGLPLLLLIGGVPVFWLPIIGLHLLVFSAIALWNQLNMVDWSYLNKTLKWIIPPSILGVLGLIKLSDVFMMTFIYCITIIYAISWLFNKKVYSKNLLIDRLLFVIGGYVSGTSLSGAPLIVAVFIHYIAKEKLRNTLFVLWFILVTIKMSTFVALDVATNWQFAVFLIPFSAIGHVVGLRFHDILLSKDVAFKRWTAGGLLIISSLGLIKIIT